MLGSGEAQTDKQGGAPCDNAHTRVVTKEVREFKHAKQCANVSTQFEDQESRIPSNEVKERKWSDKARKATDTDSVGRSKTFGRAETKR